MMNIWNKTGPRRLVSEPGATDPAKKLLEESLKHLQQFLNSTVTRGDDFIFYPAYNEDSTYNMKAFYMIVFRLQRAV